ncbi:MAG: hypothetical protein K6G11_04840, partial [Lachnospiraceae bacterium]|nr:hypothetical protein [Lachnospiraceae bacterium]
RLRIKELVKGVKVDEFKIEKENHQLLKVDGNIFKKVFTENRKYIYKGDFTAPPDDNDYSDSANYLSEDGLAGFSITKDGWLTSFFSNYGRSGFSKAVKKYIVNSAYKLVCIVADSDENNGLVRLYENLYGFRKYAATIDDTEVMRKYYGSEFIDNFVSKNGVPFHVFMIGQNAVGEGDDTADRYAAGYGDHTGNWEDTADRDAAGYGDHTGNWDDTADRDTAEYSPKIKRFKDYFEAEAYVERSVKVL